MRLLFFISFVFCLSNTFGQQKFDSSFPFQSNPNKFFSLYIPSGYSAATPQAMMLAFHPFNTSKWNGMSWRDTLLNFAEANNVLLVCPDGGIDGSVDDQEDYDFTLALIDSVKRWYNIDDKRIFAMGFSVGGKAVYEFGLEHAEMFSGFIPIGAAISGTSGLDHLLNKATCKPFYLIHGENDSPSVRYQPIKDALEMKKAEVNYILMAGVGHTITFPNRSKILRTAFRWIDTVTCKTSTGIDVLKKELSFKLQPNYFKVSQEPVILNIQTTYKGILSIRVVDIKGGEIYSSYTDEESLKIIELNEIERGLYFVELSTDKSVTIERFVVY